MKRMIMTLVAAWMMIISMNAQRLTDIRAEARFITDKMVVELGLSSVQRNSIRTSISIISMASKAIATLMPTAGITATSSSSA